MVVLFSCLPFLKHTFPLPRLPFLLSFLPPGDAATALKAAYDPRIKTEEEDGPESRPFTSKNITVPTLFEACCESLRCWHLSAPQTSFIVVEWDTAICITLPRLTTHRTLGKSLWNILALGVTLTDCPLIELISQVAPFVHHVLNLTSFCLSVPFPWPSPLHIIWYHQKPNQPTNRSVRGRI